MKLLSIGTAFAVTTLAAGALAADQSVPLQLTVFPCGADVAVAPSLRVTAMTKPPEKATPLVQSG